LKIFTLKAQNEVLYMYILYKHL